MSSTLKEMKCGLAGKRDHDRQNVETARQARIAGYDLIRSFAIGVVFCGHIITRNETPKAIRLAVCSLSPGLTMSLLGFISSALLSTRYNHAFDGRFLARRFCRIYIPLWVCILVLCPYLTWMGEDVFKADSLVHVLGLSGVFAIAGTESASPLGGGLWFVTTILALYLLLPLLVFLFEHPRGRIHFLAVVVGLTCLSIFCFESMANVAIAFCLGVFINLRAQSAWPGKCASSGIVILAPAIVLLAICMFATAGALPKLVRPGLFVFYPLAFVPLFFWLADHLPRPIVTMASLFSAVSYEFYIIHFYVINERFSVLCPGVGVMLQIVIAFAITLLAAIVLAKAAHLISDRVQDYLVQSPPARGGSV